MALPPVKLKFIFGWLLLASCLFVASGNAQSATDPQNSQPGSAPVAPGQTVPTANLITTHRFWDKENDWLFAGVAVSRALDYTSTRNFLARGREEILIPDDVVNSEAGFPALEAAGAMTSVGISYIFHHYHHHKMERWVSIVHIGVTSFGAARNYALKSKHP